MYGSPINYNFPHYQQTSALSHPSTGDVGLLYKAQDLQPYKNKQFLNKAFNSKQDYIEAFEALPHELKLKFYLLLEEVRLWGSMTDQQGYQTILNRIAHAVKVLKGYSSHQSVKQPTMEDKINQLCQYQLKKLQVYDHPQKTKQNNSFNEQSFGEYNSPDKKIQNYDHPRKHNQNNSFNESSFGEYNSPDKNVEEMWQWTENQQQNNIEENGQQQLISNQQIIIPSFDQLYPTNKPQLVYFEQPQPVKFAFLEHQGKQQAYKMSVFDIKLDDQDKETNKQLVNNHQNINITQTDLPKQQDQFQDFVDQNTNQQSKFQPNFDQIYKKQLKNTQYFRNQIMTPQTQNKNIINQVYTAFTNISVLAPQIPPLQQPYTFQINDLDMLSSQTYSDIPQKPKQQLNKQLLIQFDVPKQSVSDCGHVTTQNQQNQQDQWVEYKSNTINKENDQKVEFVNGNEQYKSECSYLSKQNDELSSQNNKISYLQRSAPLELNKSELSQRQQMTLSHNNDQVTIGHPLFQSLVSNYNTSLINKKIKHNSFQYDEQFYQILIKWLQSLEYEGSQAYIHIQSQLKIVKQIKQLTQMYTKAVQQDQQEKVQNTLKKTKILYSLILPEKTKNIVQFYIHKQNKTLSYEFSVFLINSGLSMQHIEKIIPKNNVYNRKVLASSLTTLYILHITRGIDIIPIYANKLTMYILQQYDKNRTIIQKLKQLSNQNQTIAQQSNQFQQYINGLAIIASICRRIISITKISTKNTLNNLVKVLKVCKEIHDNTVEHLSRSKKHLPILWETFEDQGIVPEKYTNTMLNLIKKGQQQYSIGSIFQELIQKEPLCKLCLGSEGVRQYHHNKQRINVHTQCWNLYNKVHERIQ